MEFATIANNSVNNQKQKKHIFNITSKLGLLIHCVFTLLFLYLDQNSLVLLNIASIFIWLSTFKCNQNHRYDLSAIIMSLAVLIHAVVATTMLGAGTGFQYYLWPVTLLILVVPALPISFSTAIALINIIAFALLSVFCTTTLTSLKVSYLFLSLLNLAMASIPFIIIAAVARYLYENQYLAISRLAEKDDLTQLFSRRFGLRMMQYYIDQLSQHNQPFCIALADVDNFKQINDTLGHSTGDEVLVSIANYLSSTLRETDICSRWGGEEFLFILPNSDLALIEKRIEDMCLNMPKQVVISNWGTPISCSFGLIQVNQHEDLKTAFKRADKLLYKAKNNGRCQVVSDHSKVLSKQNLLNTRTF
ncbi:MAG: GGDEF domain-containing protein [Marinomonas sp.]